jgi:hypothetical protein
MYRNIREVYDRLRNQSNIQDESDLKRRAWVETNRMMFEQSLTNPETTSVSSNSGGQATQKYITIIDTIWIYPIADLEFVLENTTVQFIRDGNNFIFSSLNDIINFYGEVYNRTTISQPVGNLGYSLGVGTILQGTRDRIFFKLDTGLIVIEWLLMKQITSQSDLPSGGNSPDGTIGYGSIYNDYDLDGQQDPPNEIPPSQNLDPLRFQIYNN